MGSTHQVLQCQELQNQKIDFCEDLPARGHALRHTWRTVAADCGVDELLAHFMLGHVPQNISQAYIMRLVLSAGPALRQAQRKVSKRILHLLGADPTRASTVA